MVFTEAAYFLLSGTPDPSLRLPIRILLLLMSLYGPVIKVFQVNLVMATIMEKTSVSRTVKNIANVAVFLYAVNFIFNIITPFNHMYYWVDENNVSHLADWIWLNLLLAFVSLSLMTGVVIMHRRFFSGREFIAMLSYKLLPMLVVSVYVFAKDLTVINLATTIAVVIYFAGIQSELSKQIKQKELELTESKIAIMLSQIHPHFLFNSLTAIAQLCNENPAQAKKVTIGFSEYLRGNMESLSDKGLISIEKEMNHVEGYLNLEKAIYGNALHVIYNIEVNSFSLPPLTIQPIVENAVKHGIGQREGGGTIIISTRETDDNYIITVSDDGVGYNVDSAVDSQAHKSIGINNVRRRLKEQCGGTLKIISEVGKGTTAEIRIPK
jgi:hypothetical protein